MSKSFATNQYGTNSKDDSGIAPPQYNFEEMLEKALKE